MFIHVDEKIVSHIKTSYHTNDDDINFRRSRDVKQQMASSNMYIHLQSFVCMFSAFFLK